MSSINYICTMLTSHFRVTKNTMSVAKRPRTEKIDNVTGKSGKSGGSGGELATRDANPPIMPVPSRIANQMSDYATYTLRYTELFTGVDISSNWTKQFRINSIFDPNYTDAGHQPMGRDLLATIYNYYRVLKTEFSCELARGIYADNGVIVTVEPAIIGDLVGTGVSTIPTSVATLGETKRGRCWLSPSTDNVFRWDRTIYPGLLDETIDTNGVTDQTQLSIWTPMGSNPAEEQYYTIMADTASGTISTATVLVQIKFTVQFRCPNVDVTAD